MALTIKTQADIENHLRDLGLERGSNIIVHSALIGFGLIENGPSTVYEAFKSVIGEEGTIAVPTYLLGSSPDLVFDPLNTPSLACGSFSEFVRTLKGSIRSRCPLHNHTAYGPQADLLKTVEGTTSLGHGSDFEVLHQAGFSTLMLGCPFSDGATFVMHLEAVAGVPFREWVELERRTLDSDGVVRNYRCNYYQRVGSHIVEDLAPVKDLLVASGDLSTAACGSTQSLLVRPSGYQTTLNALKSNPELTLVG